MKIKNKRAFVAACITAVLAIICIIAYISEQEQRFLISFLLLIAYSTFNLVKAFSKKGTLEELADNGDERDLFVTMKSSHWAMKAMNYVVCAFTFIFLLLYAIWKQQYLIIIAGTLCAVLILMTIVFLTINIYLEKHE